MTAVLIDSNVLLDLMTEDAQWFAWSAAAVESAADRFRLVINPIIYAEVSVRHSRIEDLEAALPKEMFEREAIPYEAAFLAGKAFLAYRRCEGTKRSTLPDFFIGSPCRDCRVPVVDPRCNALSQLLSRLAVDHPELRSRSTACHGVRGVHHHRAWHTEPTKLIPTKSIFSSVARRTGRNGGAPKIGAAPVS